MLSSPLKKRSLAGREVMEQETAMKAAEKLSSQNTENLVWRKKIERDTPRGSSMELFDSEAEKKRQKKRIEENGKIETLRKTIQFHKQTVDDSDHNSRDRKSEPEKEEKLPIEEIPLGSELEVAVDPQIYDWRDRFQPRKPKYSNRVHTGYRWTRYNRTHYDRDHPPPKMVKGYEFKVHYPDQLDKTKVPGYSIEKDGDRKETCIIRFHAGPPYEDIAFGIVNDEWDYSASVCEFENGVLCLCFRFKQYVYRR